VLTAASLQVGFTSPNFKILEHFNDFADAEIKKVVKGAPQVDPEDGCFHLSDAPGLGVELDVDAAAEFPQQQARFDLWAEGWEKRAPKASA
jgi:galactonate dehydratase